MQYLAAAKIASGRIVGILEAAARYVDP